jgi:hypothetical protein
MKSVFRLSDRAPMPERLVKAVAFNVSVFETLIGPE